MMLLALLFPVVLLANGLAAGVLLATQLGGWPYLQRLPDREYVAAHAFFSTRYDPWMPLCIAVSAVGGAVLVAVLPGWPTRALLASAVVLILTTGAISLTRNVPGNRYVRTLSPADLPPDFAAHDPRPTWGRWNRIRSVLAILAFVVDCAALGVVLAPASGI